MSFQKGVITIIAAGVLTACGGGGGGGSSSSSSNATTTNTSTNTPVPTAPASVTPAQKNVTISGAASFDLIPHITGGASLDLGNTRRQPIRQAVVEAVNSSNKVIATGQTDNLGQYNLTVPANENIAIRVSSRSQASGRSSHIVSIVDNVQGNAIYVLSGAYVNSGENNSVRDIHAPSGWDGTTYSSTRAAAPFAVMDNIISAMDIVRQSDSDIDFPELKIGWSENNVPIYSDNQPGLIGTSSFITSGPNKGMILLLGDASADADEYDGHVVVHEWAHYFENTLSRGDSLGGPHSLHTPLDPRVAMSEGFASALAALILDDPIYRDSRGGARSGGFSFDIENDSASRPGWFSESSVQSIIYDLGDQSVSSEDHDQVNLGFGPIIKAMTSDKYKEQDSFTTIFSLLAEIKAQNPSVAANIEMLAAHHNITGQGYKGIGELNNGGLDSVLPLYKTYDNSSTTSLCSSAQLGVYNKLGNRDYITVNLINDARYELKAIRNSGPMNSAPVIKVFSATDLLGEFNADANGEVAGAIDLSAGAYRIEVYDGLKLRGGYTETSVLT